MYFIASSLVEVVFVKTNGRRGNRHLGRFVRLQIEATRSPESGRRVDEESST
jgi:hypothetical protein